MRMPLLTHVNITQCPDTGVYAVTVNDRKRKKSSQMITVKNSGKVAQLIVMLLEKYPRLTIYAVGIVSPIQLAQAEFTKKTGNGFNSKIILNGGGSCLTA